MANINKNNQNYFFNLIKENRLNIINGDIFIDNRKLKPFKSQCKGNKTDYYFGIYHKRHRILVHRLVWMFYNKKMIPNNYEINHIDGNKRNNDINNLELVTAAENVRHAYRLGLNKVSDLTKILASKRLREFNPKQVFKKELIEYYRTRYYSKKLTKNDIIRDSGASRRAVENMLKFESYQYDPITGEYDPELHTVSGISYIPNKYISYPKNNLLNFYFKNGDLNYLLEMYKSGTSIYELSKEYNVSELIIIKAILYFNAHYNDDSNSSLSQEEIEYLSSFTD